LLEVGRVYECLGRGRWFCQVKSNGRIKLGEYQYYLGKRLAGCNVEVTCDPRTGHLLCRPEAKPVAVAVSIQGVTVNDLMGALDGVTRLPTCQLALPLSARENRAQQYVVGLTGTAS
jgi:hypothetical protein